MSNLYFRNVSHDTDFQEIRQVEASTKFREPSILDEESMSFGRRNNDAGDDDLSDLLGSKKVMFTTLVPHLNSICYTDFRVLWI